MRVLRLIIVILFLFVFASVILMSTGAVETRSDATRAMSVLATFLVGLLMIAWSPSSWKGWAVLALCASIAIATFVNPSSQIGHIDPIDISEDGVALVTGASKGIGLAVARLLLSEYGFKTIVVVSRSPPPEEKGIVWIQADLAEPASVNKVIDLIKSQYKRLDLVVLNAAIGAGMKEPDVNGFPKLLRINYLYQVKLLHLLMDLVKVGRIVFVASDAHHFADYSVLANLTAPFEDPVWTLDISTYGKTKALQIAYAKALAQQGVNAVSVHPGLIASEIAQADMNELFGPGFSQSRLFFFVDGFEELALLVKRVLLSSLKLLGESTEKGARRVIYAALHRGVPSGSYVAHCRADDGINPKLLNPDLIERVRLETKKAIRLI